MTNNPYENSLKIVEAKVDCIPDFPKPGILFRDLTPLWADHYALQIALDILCHKIVASISPPLNLDFIAGAEARGFILGQALATHLRCGFVALRKPGKLPRETHSASYDLEYGTNTLHLQKNALPAGSGVLVVDDLLATGGTAEACVSLVKMAECEVVGAAFMIELKDLHGREKLKGVDVYSVLEY